MNGSVSLTLSSCGTVELAPEISAEMIRQKLALYDCGMVTCMPGQLAAAESVAVGCGYISSAGEVQCRGDVVLENDDREDTIEINANEYRF